MTPLVKSIKIEQFLKDFDVMQILRPFGTQNDENSADVIQSSADVRRSSADVIYGPTGRIKRVTASIALELGTGLLSYIRPFSGAFTLLALMEFALPLPSILLTSKMGL